MKGNAILFAVLLSAAVSISGCTKMPEAKELVLKPDIPVEDGARPYGVTEITSVGGEVLFRGMDSDNSRFMEHIRAENTVSDSDYVNLYFRILPRDWDRREAAYGSIPDPEVDWSPMDTSRADWDPAADTEFKKENFWRGTFSKVLYLDILCRENELDSVLQKCVLTIRKRGRKVYHGPAAQTDALKICRLNPGEKTDFTITLEIPEKLSAEERKLIENCQPTLVAMELNEKVGIDWRFQEYDTEKRNVRKLGDILEYTVTITNTGNTDIVNPCFEESYNGREFSCTLGQILRPTAYQMLGGWYDKKTDPDPKYDEQWAYINELDEESGCHVIHLVFSGFPDNPDLRDDPIRIEKDLEYYPDDER